DAILDRNHRLSAGALIEVGTSPVDNEGGFARSIGFDALAAKDRNLDNATILTFGKFKRAVRAGVVNASRRSAVRRRIPDFEFSGKPTVAGHVDLNHRGYGRSDDLNAAFRTKNASGIIGFFPILNTETGTGFDLGGSEHDRIAVSFLQAAIRFRIGHGETRHLHEERAKGTLAKEALAEGEPHPPGKPGVVDVARAVAKVSEQGLQEVLVNLATEVVADLQRTPKSLEIGAQVLQTGPGKRRLRERLVFKPLVVVDEDKLGQRPLTVGTCAASRAVIGILLANEASRL